VVLLEERMGVAIFLPTSVEIVKKCVTTFSVYVWIGTEIKARIEERVWT
jgi:hypothetical protein